MRGSLLGLASLLVVACGTGRGDAADSSGTKPVDGAGGSVSATNATPVAPASGQRERIIFLGTSLTAGLGLEPDSAYPQRLQRKLDSLGLSYEVVNAGVSGETSAGLLRRLDWVLQQPARVIVVETGANDGLRGLEVDATRATIGRVLDRIRAERPEATVALVQMEAPPNLGTRYTAAFHAMFPGLAREKGAVLLPFLLEGVAGDARLNQADGIHPNDAGERVVTENVWKGLERMLRPRG